MAEGSPTWDLSPNDIAALKTVLQDAARYRVLRSNDGDEFNPYVVIRCQDAVVGTWIYTGERLDEVADGMKQI